MQTTPLDKISRATLLVIFGVTGDLSRRKLLPAVWDLYIHNVLPETFRLIGFSRSELSDDGFREYVKNILTEARKDIDRKKLNSFLQLLTYRTGLFDNLEDYEALQQHLTDQDMEIKECSNKLFYLAVPPRFYDVIFDHLASSKLTSPCSEEEGWARVLVEKPFGKDLETAKALDKKLGELFKEEQVFRIDHYLARETVQNILNFRFSNYIFESLWSKDDIEKVEISMMEPLGMEGRGNFYDGIGALRDVGQSHILQLLAMVTMDNPGSFDAQRIRQKRAEILKSLHSVDDMECVIRGQYAGYRMEEGVEPDSQTETYFRIKAFLDHPRWEGVPFYLESGKMMKEFRNQVKIYFKKATLTLCPIDGGSGCQNYLSFDLKPKEGISVCFWAKKPGFSREIEPRTLHFRYEEQEKQRLPEAYEYVLYDCMRGDQVIFTSTDEVQASWKFISPILEKWKNTPLVEYESGQWGPEKKSV